MAQNIGPRKLGLRFSLRTLLLGLTLSALAAAWLGHAAREYEQERKALAQIWGEESKTVPREMAPRYLGTSLTLFR